MKTVTQIMDQLAGDQDISEPELIKVDVQVRTGGIVLPPSWRSPAKQASSAEAAKN